MGERGAYQTKGPWPPARAIQEFKKQFKAKTATDWENRVGMVQKKGACEWLYALRCACAESGRAGKYVWIERSYDDEDEAEEDKKAGSSSKEDEKIPDSTLPSEIQVRMLSFSAISCTDLLRRLYASSSSTLPCSTLTFRR